MSRGALLAQDHQLSSIVPFAQVIDDEDHDGSPSSSWKAMDDLMGLPVKGALHGAASAGGHFEPLLRLTLGTAKEHTQRGRTQ